MFEPHYAQAERLFHVHGLRGEDPLKPRASGPHPHAPVSHEPKIAEWAQDFKDIGLNPFHLPLSRVAVAAQPTTVKHTSAVDRLVTVKSFCAGR